MKCSAFGTFDGKQVKLYTITAGDMTAEIITYGGVLRSLIVPDKNGKPTDVCLGYDTVEEYATNEGYIGALIGRVGNRIGEGKFMLNGKEYNVGLNDNGNSLHGGVKGWNAKVWDDEVINDTTLKLSIVSPDGEEGFPGTVKVEVTYTLIENRGIKIEYKAVSDKDTVINMTNHAYFNLNGQGNGDILGNTLMIDADAIVPVDEKLIPHGEILSVEGTCFDFRKEKSIGQDIETEDLVMEYCGGYDVNFCLNGDGYRKVTVAKGDKSGITMAVYTLEKGIQLYSGNFLKGVKGKGGAVYNKRNGFCLETQNYPNAINCPEYPSMVLKAGEVYSTVTEYVFEK